MSSKTSYLQLTACTPTDSVMFCAPSSVLARGERGELVFRSPSLLNCYLNNETATRESFDEEGWFYTGDVGIIDESDNVYIVDRLKEVIKVKG